MLYNPIKKRGENLKYRIKKLRKELDLTQQEFADKIGMKRNTVANYETGRNEPSASVISLICKEFNVNEDWLRSGNGEMFNPEPKNELDILKNKYSLSSQECALIDVFVNMNQKDRQTVMEFIVKMADNIRMQDPFYGDVPDTPEELERLCPPIDIRNRGKVG